MTTLPLPKLPLTAALPALAGGLSLAACGQRNVSSQAQALLAPITTPAGFEIGKLSLSGRVALKGSPPKVDVVVDASGDPHCRKHPPISTENWKVSPRGGLAEVVISIPDAPPTLPEGSAPHVTQEGCRYLPHVIALSRAETLEVSNGDATFHNVRVVEHRKGTLNQGVNVINYSQPGRGSRNTHAFASSGIFRLECDVHRWMQCWVFVADNNHLAVSGDDGTFELKRGLRDGTYTVQAWHHHFAEPLTKSVTVVEGKAEVNFEFDGAQALN
ncbi:MAG: carboxypeptidase regulatory-like domain-containing protein [Verrucomicrobiales bacterium]